MNDPILQQIIDKTQTALNGGFGVLSTAEKLAAALVLNRHDWLVEMNYTIAEAIERLGPEWVDRIPPAELAVRSDTGLTGAELVAIADRLALRGN